MTSIFSKDSEENKKLKSFIRGTFGIKSRNIDFYITALTHKSYAHENKVPNNERLEFLGDTVLDVIIAKLLYLKYPQKNEGELTQIKSRLVSRETLGKLGYELRLHDHIRFVNGNHINLKTLCGNSFESIVGAIYLDKGFKKTEKAIVNLYNNKIDIKEVINENTDYKSQIIIWSQKSKKKIKFEESIIKSKGPNTVYKSEIICEGKLLGRGEAFSKKKAEQKAAKQALNHRNRVKKG